MLEIVDPLSTLYLRASVERGLVENSALVAIARRLHRKPILLAPRNLVRP